LHADRGVYAGDVRNSKANGYGAQLEPDGTFYEGGWLDD
jgi:hypothetical protein